MHIQPFTVYFSLENPVANYTDVSRIEEILLGYEEFVGLCALAVNLRTIDGLNRIFIFSNGYLIDPLVQTIGYLGASYDNCNLTYICELASIDANYNSEVHNLLFKYDDENFLEGIKKGCQLMGLNYDRIVINDEMVNNPEDESDGESDDSVSSASFDSDNYTVVIEDSDDENEIVPGPKQIFLELSALLPPIIPAAANVVMMENGTFLTDYDDDVPDMVVVKI